MIGTEYYVIAGFHRRLILTRVLRDELTALLSARIEESSAIATAEEEKMQTMLKNAKNIFRAPRKILFHEKPS